MSSEAFDEVDDSEFVGLGANVKKNDVLGVQESAEAFEEPQVGGEFGAVEVFEAAEEFEKLWFGIGIDQAGRRLYFVFESGLFVGEGGVPEVLVEE